MGVGGAVPAVGRTHLAPAAASCPAVPPLPAGEHLNAFIYHSSRSNRKLQLGSQMSNGTVNTGKQSPARPGQTQPLLACHHAQELPAPAVSCTSSTATYNGFTKQPEPFTMYVLGGQGLHRVAFPREDETPAICRHLCHGTAGAPGLPKPRPAASALTACKLLS